MQSLRTFHARPGAAFSRGLRSCCTPVCARSSHGPRRASVHVRAAFLQTNNPAFRAVNRSVTSRRYDELSPMTVDGTVQKTSVLLAASLAAAAITWMQIFSGNLGSVASVISTSAGCGIAAFMTAMVTMFNPRIANVTAPLYAVAKGIALGGMTAVMELSVPGVAMNALLLTMGTAASLFMALQTRLIRVTDRFRDCVVAVTGGFFLMWLLVMVLGFCGLQVMPLFSAGPLAMGVALFSAGLASMNLLLDFDMVQQCAYEGAPKWMEWYSGFSMMLTLVWMYTEIARLLMMVAGMRGDD